MSVISYAALFRGRDDDGLGLVGIQIPMIQRDYAQGREDPKTSRIRNDFIATLTAAVTPDPTGAVKPVGLDFVYGDVRQGVLLPLDGQQRLTALFLLHWYLAVRSGGTDAPWLTFAYETRASARQFCEEMRKAASLGIPTEGKPEFSSQKPSEWIKDQSWFMPGWTSEPTIASMLVVLDNMHERLADVDAEAALTRLTDRFSPAIEFHVLDLKDMKLDDDIYVRMNSRGKPLTDFEIFKARFGAKLEKHFPDRAREFAQRIDGVWLDAFWCALTTPDGQPAADGQIDAAILRYMRFLADFVDAREGGRITEGDSEAEVCLRVFGEGGDGAKEKLDWLFHGFDIWTEIPDLSAWFSVLFRDGSEAAQEGDTRLPLFDLRQRDATNLFLACCRHYSPDRHKTEFPTRFALLLYAIVFSKYKTDAPLWGRLRTIRNLVDWSGDEIRPNNMKPLITQTEDIMAGNWPDYVGFNAAQRDDERRKRDLLDYAPFLETSLYALEDHHLLRGRLLAFRLDPQTLLELAAAFERGFGQGMNHDAMAAGLLAASDYTDRGYVVRRLVPAKSQDVRWRDVLTGTRRGEFNSPIRVALDTVLSCMSDTTIEPIDCLRTSLTQPFLDARATAHWFDWRYYFVAYPSMRDSAQGCYSPVDVDGAPQMGYVVRRHHNLEAAIRDTDPYLMAVCDRLGEDRINLLSPKQAGQVYYGQTLHFGKIGIAMESRQDGWHVFLSDEQTNNVAIQSVFAEFGLQKSVTDNGVEAASIGEIWHLPIAQTDTVPDGMATPSMREVSLVDLEDRVSRAAEFISALLHATIDADTADNAEGTASSESPIPCA
jgi:hypothetical protein